MVLATIDYHCSSTPILPPASPPFAILPRIGLYRPSLVDSSIKPTIAFSAAIMRFLDLIWSWYLLPLAIITLLLPSCLLPCLPLPFCQELAFIDPVWLDSSTKLLYFPYRCHSMACFKPGVLHSFGPPLLNHHFVSSTAAPFGALSSLTASALPILPFMHPGYTCVCYVCYLIDPMALQAYPPSSTLPTSHCYYAYCCWKSQQFVSMFCLQKVCIIQSFFLFLFLFFLFFS